MFLSMKGDEMKFLKPKRTKNIKQNNQDLTMKTLKGMMLKRVLHQREKPQQREVQETAVF